MVRKLASFTQKLLPVVLNLMLDLDDDPDWSQADEEEATTEITNADVGDECLDRLALALGGKTLTPVLFQLIPGLLGNENWKQRHTGLMAISLTGEGCERFLQDHLEKVLKLVVPRITDPHPRVRWAACNTLGQMASDFGPGLQMKFHEYVNQFL